MDTTASRDATGSGSRRPPIVIGIDGSPAALRAAGWAAADAVARQVPVLLVHVVPPIDKPAFRPGGIRYRRAAQTLDAARRTVLALSARVEVDTVVVRGQLDRTLIEMSRSATMLAVGSRGTGFVAHLLLGSTALAAVRGAHCPVAVVRGSDNPAGSVLVPITTWPAAEPTLTAGLRAAASRGAEMLVARIWQGRRWSDIPHIAAPAAVTDAQIAHCRLEFPSVTVRSVTITEHPIDAIEQFSAAAQLVVVDHDGNGHHLGPRALDLVLHARCPVLVLPVAATTHHMGASDRGAGAESLVLP